MRQLRSKAAARAPTPRVPRDCLIAFVGKSVVAGRLSAPDSAFIGLGVAAGVDGGDEGFIQTWLVAVLDSGHPAVPDPETADRRLSTERIRRSNINISSGRPGRHRATMRQRGARFSAHFGRATLSHEPGRTGAASGNV